MKKLVTLFISIFALSISQSQTTFLAKGKIEFERKINVHRQFDDMVDDDWFKEYVTKMPKFNTSFFDLYFDEKKTIYKPGRETQNSQVWGIGPAKENVIVTDLQKKISTGQKAVFEDTYL